jgi:hypothetical protein
VAPDLRTGQFPITVEASSLALDDLDEDAATEESARGLNLRGPLISTSCTIDEAAAA